MSTRSVDSLRPQSVSRAKEYKPELATHLPEPPVIKTSRRCTWLMFRPGLHSCMRLLAEVALGPFCSNFSQQEGTVDVL